MTNYKIDLKIHTKKKFLHEANMTLRLFKMHVHLSCTRSTTATTDSHG